MTHHTPRQIAEAFSGHRFDEVFDHLADDVRWVLPGHDPIEGKEAVVAACRAALAEQAAPDFERFVAVGDERSAAVDAVARYADPDGGVSVVSSADVYECDEGGQLVRITSYAVELPG